MDSNNDIFPQEKDGTPIVYVCHGKHCGRTAPYIVSRLEQVQKKGYQFHIEQATCMGHCERCPNVRFRNNIHHKQTPISVSEMMKKQTNRKQ